MKKDEKVIQTFEQLHSAALEQLLLSLVRQLHERGVIDARELIARRESVQAFGQAAFRMEPNQVMTDLLVGLSKMLDADEQAQQQRPGRT